MRGVCYAGYIDAHTGMAAAARNIIMALIEAGVEITIEKVPNLVSPDDLGENYKTISERLGKKLNYDIKIIHTTPDLIFKHLDPMKYHIHHLFWETDKLPDWWVWALNHGIDEIWTGDHYHEKVFRDSGITKPIWVCPQPIDTSEKKYKKYSFRRPKKYYFYSIFQWIERKNPKKLLSAYWKEFEGDNNVCLLIKTFIETFTLQETEQIIKDVILWKKELNLSHYPAVYLVTDSKSYDQIMRIHETGDCYVTAHRGEGYGIPIAEAMFHGKPVISTNLGGIHEWIPEDCAYLLDYKLVSVFNMDFVPWYDKEQKWAEVDENQLREKMRYIYDHQGEAQLLGERGKRFVERELSYLTIGNKMKNRLEEIEKEHKF